MKGKGKGERKGAKGKKKKKARSNGNTRRRGAVHEIKRQREDSIATGHMEQSRERAAWQRTT